MPYCRISEPSDASRSAPSRLRASRRLRRNERSGFTLAGLIVILTILMIFVAYTVPRMWSTI